MYVVCYLCRTADNVLYVSNTNFLPDNKVYLILSYVHVFFVEKVIEAVTSLAKSWPKKLRLKG